MMTPPVTDEAHIGKQKEEGEEGKLGRDHKQVTWSGKEDNKVKVTTGTVTQSEEAERDTEDDGQDGKHIESDPEKRAEGIAHGSNGDNEDNSQEEQHSEAGVVRVDTAIFPNKKATNSTAGSKEEKQDEKRASQEEILESAGERGMETRSTPPRNTFSLTDPLGRNKKKALLMKGVTQDEIGVEDSNMVASRRADGQRSSNKGGQGEKEQGRGSEEEEEEDHQEESSMGDGEKGEPCSVCRSRGQVSLCETVTLHYTCAVQHL